MIKFIFGAAAAVALIVAAFIAFAFRRQRSFFPHPLIRHPGIDYEIA